MSRQDVENATAARIALAEMLARQLGFSQIIIFGHHQECGTVITTWGDDAERSAQAAAGANHVKKLWGWPEDTIVESAKVQALKDRIAELEAQVAAKPEPPRLQYGLVHVIEGTEYERGWGQRPDGYIAFKSKEEALAYIAQYDKRFNNAKHAPDCYTKYDYVGEKAAASRFMDKLISSKSGYAFFDNISELKA